MSNPNAACFHGREPHHWREEYHGHRCEVCGLFYPHGTAPWDPDDFDDFDDADDGEPIGSCDNCQSNLYRGDEYGGLCSQCAWWADQE